jgi:phosphomannomutase/phosphoglucomutase
MGSGAHNLSCLPALETRRLSHKNSLSLDGPKKTYNLAMTEKLEAFRLGDIRGIYPEDIDAEFAIQFAHAFAQHFSLKGHVAIGRDMRASSVVLQDGLNQGFTASGLNVVNLGLCATELGYFASSMPDIAAVIVVTASHNPARYNGFKCVLQGGVGIHYENGLRQVMELMLAGHNNRVSRKGKVTSRDYHAQYIEFLKGRFDIDGAKAGVIALNGLNGTASTLAADIAYEFELPVTWFRKEPGPIPDGGADPINPELRLQMFDYMQSDHFSLGVAWDGDCDRCVFFDGEGRYVPSYYMVGFLADHILGQSGPGAIVYDTKIYWNLMEVIRRHGAQAVPSRTGHAFMKENMKRHNALYGGELSSHHYFGDFFHCDSGMYAWLKAVEFITRLELPLEELVAERRHRFKCTTELSIVLTSAQDAAEALLKKYAGGASRVDRTDGLALDMGSWRFSIRDSKTEPVVRVNFETVDSGTNLIEYGARVLQVLEPFRADDAEWWRGLEVE